MKKRDLGNMCMYIFITTVAILVVAEIVLFGFIMRDIIKTY
ncbi:unnamed protein product [Acanthoscelides obtectus]|uniref:Uncharacterized protein n=1 Tax=Acanthoscelides obtectus TaxID=200917 RepID=A0A9P0PLF7_ACAOB|nr:unnamed protein product [Acanthoscelides obtectus]CAK1630926.1 hypothetical protein AOBTE_LOCUS6646 [Acanthoscelides obtectus]